jgi:sugar O-acyltransferase (sialic acid O-acetyltransferase NeuD family)
MEMIIIYGCGGHARSVADVLLSIDSGASMIFVDQNAEENEKIMGIDVKAFFDLKTEHYFVAIGDNNKRKIKFNEIKSDNLISVISSQAYVSRTAAVSPGCFVGNFCHIGPQTEIGLNTIINTASIVEHEVKIGKYCHVSSNVTIAGRSILGDFVFLGTGSIVKDNISICSNVIIGAGSTVITNILIPGTYVGTPAKKIK